MQTQATPQSNGAPAVHTASAEGEAALPPSFACRCGASETAAIIRLLDELPAARQAIEAWDGVSRDQHQRARRKYSRLLADLFQRYPDAVLAGLHGTQAHACIWIALSIIEAPSARAVPALEQALAKAQDALDRKALAEALRVCREPAG
ncbi:MAG TPA: hypothetical protein VH105_06250 [Burkholderiales bacterium]|jgi:hypothetical protein|nr:hypothetical protein [Burkholderiales bacterium]